MRPSASWTLIAVRHGSAAVARSHNANAHVGQYRGERQRANTTSGGALSSSRTSGRVLRG
jgi:hypothetical protein